jgi:hypothetical protein
MQRSSSKNMFFAMYTFLVGILPSESIEYGKIPTKKVKVGFRVAMAFNCGKYDSSLRNLKLSPTTVH